VAIILGALLMIIGQISLAGLGILAVFKEWSLITKVVSGIFTKIGPIMLVILVVALTVYLLYKLWTSKLSLVKKIILTIIIVLLAVIAILIILGVLAVGPWVLAGIAILALIGIVTLFWGHWKEIGLKALKFLFEMMLKLIVWPLELMIKAANLIPGVDIKSPFEHIDAASEKIFGGAIGKLEAERLAVEAEPKTEAPDIKSTIMEKLGFGGAGGDNVTQNISFEQPPEDKDEWKDMLKEAQEEIGREGLGSGS